jgi:Flp pilus assembly protein TadD
MAERGVGCEACHGPMKAHNDWQHAHKNSHLTDPTIRKFTRDEYFGTCAGCHSRRGEITGDPAPGDDYFDHHLMAIVDDSQTFYPDGQIWDEDYEVTAFMGSKMYQKGVRCMDCHNVHTMKTRLPGNFLCLSCHGPGSTNAPAINPVWHSHHKVFGYDTNGVLMNANLAAYQPGLVKETGGECVNCHMPQTPYMQRHWRHDHGFTIPDPLLTKEFGIPNACERCHADKGTDWNLKYVEQWYGTNMSRPYRQHAEIVARARQGDDAVRDDVVKILQTDAQAYWRAVAARMLERWTDEPKVVSALAEKLADTNALVRQSVAQALAANDLSQSSEVREALERCLDDPSRGVRVTAAQGLASGLDLHSRAGTDLLQMLEHNADQPAGQRQLGVLALERGEMTNALRYFQTAERWDAYSPEIHAELAVVYSRIGRSGEAVTELRQAVRLAPKEAELHFKLALALNELGESSNTLAELETAVKLNPRHARAQYNLGLARNAAGDPTGAIQALLAAETADPRDPRIPYARATICAHLGEFREAREAARRAMELDPQFSEAADLLQQLPAR